MPATTDRRKFIQGITASGAALTLRYAPAAETKTPAATYRRWEDLMRNKWTWDRVTRGTHGTNCAGTWDWGHLGYRPLAFAPNQTYRDFTCDFEKADVAGAAASIS